MQNSNGANRPDPAELGDTPEWQPTPEQPWRPVVGDDSGAPFQFDYGADRCADRVSHTQFQDDGYPSLNHQPTECRSYDGWFGAKTDDGRPSFLSAYLVRPFRFGQLGQTVDETRLAIEFDPAEDGVGELFWCTAPRRSSATSQRT